MFRNLSLWQKITIAILVIAALISAVSFYQNKAVDRVEHASQELVEEDLKRLEALHEARLNTAYLHQERVISESTATRSTKIDPEDLKALQEEIATHAKKVSDSIQEYSQLASRDKDHAPDQQLLSDLTTASDNLLADVAALQTEDDQETFTAIDGSAHQLEEVIASLAVKEKEIVKSQEAQIQAATKRVKALFALRSIAVTTAAVLIGVVLVTSISRSLAKLRAGASRIANGDFSSPIEVRTKDEIGLLGLSLNNMAERLRESYRRLAVEQQRDEAIIQGIGEGLIAVDEEAKIVLINHVAAKYLGVETQDELVGKLIYDVFDLYDMNDKNEQPLKTEDRPVFAAISSSQTIKGVYSYRKPDKSRFLMDVTATPIILDDKVIGAISVMRDVTKEKEIDRMKTEFISLASHQLRTPLSAIKWFTEMLIAGDAGELTPDQKEFAKNIDDSTERMIALVNALLNISRIESGRIMVDPKPTDLRELVSGIITDLKAKTEERQQTLIISVHDELPKINLDPRLIGQVYLNLLTNAVKYTPKGGEISVFISKKGDEIISQVTDNGYGIPKEQQDRVFQKFFRAANAVKVETDGTGLGLYLIKAVIESSGGKIWFESEEGKGTTFWFSIPLSGMKAKEGEVTLDV